MKYLFFFIALAIVGCKSQSKEIAIQEPEIVHESVDPIAPRSISSDSIARIKKSDAEWKAQLSEMEYYVLRQEGTERSFTSPLLKEKRTGVFRCKACDLALFSSETKFKSGTGWPSFYQPLDASRIHLDVDYNLGYARSEVECARCGGHMGHVFDDGPAPTGLRYCINGVSLSFDPKIN